jgi:hypothetical protein
MKINPKTKAKIVEAARIDILFLMSSTADWTPSIFAALPKLY